MMTFDEATECIAALITPLSAETIHISAAAGRTLAASVVAAFDSPRAQTSAMDGFAIRDHERTGDHPRFQVVGSSYPGQPFQGETPPGSAVRVFTGAIVPPSLDRVIMQEAVEDTGDTIVVARDPGTRRHIRAKGSDFKSGDTIAPKGVRLTPPMLAAIAGADACEVTAHKMPKVAVLTTGDELVAPGTARRIAHAVPDSLSVSLAAMVEVAGGTVGDQLRLRDNKAAVAGSEEHLIAAHDVTVIAGGASVGVRDFAKDLFGALDPDFIFNKVAMKPGKPVWLAQAGKHFIVGLPGNPGSALVTARLFLVPLISALSGRTYSSALEWREVTLAAPLKANGAREDFQRGTYVQGHVTCVANQDSSAQAPLAISNVLIRRTPNEPARNSGDKVSVLDF